MRETFRIDFLQLCHNYLELNLEEPQRLSYSFLSPMLLERYWSSRVLFDDSWADCWIEGHWGKLGKVIKEDVGFGFEIDRNYVADAWSNRDFASRGYYCSRVDVEVSQRDLDRIYKSIKVNSEICQGVYERWNRDEATWESVVAEDVELSKSDTGISNCEGSKKIVSEENEPFSVDEIAMKAVEWGVFKEALSNLSLYWAGRANPGYACSDAINLSRVIMTGLNDYLHFMTGDWDNPSTIKCVDAKTATKDARRMIEAIASCNETFLGGEHVPTSLAIECVGMSLISWALLHKFYEVHAVCGFVMYDTDGILSDYDMWDVQGLLYTMCLPAGERWAFDICEGFNHRWNKRVDAILMDGMAQQCGLMMDRAEDKRYESEIKESIAHGMENSTAYCAVKSPSKMVTPAIAWSWWR